MPDTSAAGSDWVGVGTALASIVAGIAVWLGKWHAGKDQAKSPVTPLPEAAGVAMALIDQKVQAEIAKDTERTADAAERSADTLERVEDIMRKFIEDAEEAREQQEKRGLEDRAERAEREAERLQRLLEDSRRNAGPYSTSPRPKDLLRDVE